MDAKKAPVIHRGLKKVLASAYFPTNSSAVSSAREGLTSEFGMGSGVPLPPWTPRQIRYEYVIDRDGKEIIRNKPLGLLVLVSSMDRSTYTSSLSTR